MNKQLILKLHLSFWGLVLLVLSVSYISEAVNAENLKIQWTYFIRMLFRLIIFYVFYLTAPKYLNNKKRIILFITGGLLFLGLTSFVFDYLLINFLAYLNGNTYNSYNFKYMYLELLSGHFIYASIGSLFSASNEWYIKSRNSAELEIQNTGNKIALLRAQINPHFLFNTLNNINSFIYNSPEKAVYSIAKLKLIMNYFLNGSNPEKVSLEQDIEIIKNYIELQKIRYANPDFIAFNIKGDFRGISIPPLLFMPFIENAFKHGKKINSGPGIIINFVINSSLINFNSFNYISGNKKLTEETGGFGLKNINRRLELIYKDKYVLNTNSTADNYYVNLRINLDKV